MSALLRLLSKKRRRTGPLEQADPDPFPTFSPLHASAATAVDHTLSPHVAVRTANGGPAGAAAAGLPPPLPPPITPLVQTLADDASPQALRPPGGMSALIALCEAVVQGRLKARSAKTRQGDEYAMRRFQQYCATLATPYWRTDVWKVNDAVFQREVLLLCGFLIWLTTVLPGKAKDSPNALPKSCMNVVYAVRRAHADRGITMVPCAAVGQTLKHLTDEYAREHGPESLLPKRKQPFEPRRVAEFRTRVSAGANVAGRPLDWTTPFFVMLWAVITLASNAGFRKAEVAVPAGSEFSNMRLSRAHLVWRLVNPASPKGFDVLPDPPAERLRALRPGDYAMIQPPPSKTDPWGTTWGNEFIYLPFVPGDAVNAAAALAALELTFPVAVALRRSVPLFAVCPRTFEALRGPVLDGVMKSLFRLVSSSDEEAATYSFHSFRIGIATALLAAGYDYPAIKAHCRWSSDASVKLYGRQTPEAFAERLARARVQTVTPLVVAQYIEQRIIIDGDVAATATAAAATIAIDANA